jgi:methionyl aminopeptidase
MIAKTPDERMMLREGGRRLGQVLAEAAQAVQPGIELRELDAIAERRIIEFGGRPAFKGYRTSHTKSAFPGTLCISVNDEVVHGIPTRAIILKEGDIVGLDIGMEWPAKDGLYTDTAMTVSVGSIPPDIARLLEKTSLALDAAIRAAVVGERISDIAKAAEQIISVAGFGIVRDLVGHGVGLAVHEDPQIPNFWDGQFPDRALEDGLTIAIEPMVTIGSPRVRTRDDGWTVVTEDRSLAAHFEHTVLITNDGTEILTNRA